jgi:NAD(P)-dependent dehydrogenase (short-subunit alcohol dehydrogenase family)
VDLKLTGKRAVVTGGSQGIGRAVAETLLDEGADVALVSRTVETLDRSAAELSGRAGRVVPIAADTTDDDSVRRMAARAIELLGGVDILVNSAAPRSVPGPQPKLSEITDDAARLQFETKVLGYLRCARALAPGMAERGWGRIINISGMNARSSSSLVGSIRNVSVADELGPDGINVTVVHPGYTVTEQTPDTVAAIARAQGVETDTVVANLSAATSIGRLITAAEVASVVAFLASPLSVAITGDVIAAGGGQRGPIYY